jgi:hypothetical protein
VREEKVTSTSSTARKALTVMDSLRNIEPLMKLRNPGDRESKMENFAGFVFRITSRRSPLPPRRNGIYRQFSENSSSQIIFRSVRAVLR